MSRLWFMGFLSLASLYYFNDGNLGWLAFIGFLPYFLAYKVRDERLEQNLGKATKKAFSYLIIFGVLSIVYISMTNNIGLFAPAFIAIFAGSLLVCLISLFYYDRKG